MKIEKFHTAMNRILAPMRKVFEEKLTASEKK